MTAQRAASGVQDLINRIRDEGVQSAQAEANRMLAEARSEAARIVATAKRDAQAMRKSAREEIETETTAAIEALRIAARDTGLQLRTAVFSAFEEHVRRLVTDVTTDGSILRDLVLVLAGRTAGEVIKDRDATILIPGELSEEANKELESFLRESAAALSGQVLREGIELIPSSEVRGGARVQLVGEDLEIDLSDEALSEMMLGLLLPRYRALLVEAGQ
jgi:V/A-type H+-transporting ATPase subunit E